MSKKYRKRLYRSSSDKIIAGVFGGIGEYFDIDANLLRVVVLFIIFLTFFGGLVPFLVIYFITMFIIPSERERIRGKDENVNEDEAEDDNYTRDGSKISKPVYKKWVFWLIIVVLLSPVILIILGFLFFTARTSNVTDNVRIREERIIIERPKSSPDYMRIYEDR